MSQPSTQNETSGPDAVSAAVWPWRHPVSTAPDPRVTRRRATIQGLVVLAICSLLFFGFGHRVAPAVILAIGLTISLSGWVLPALFHRIEAAGRQFGHGVGTALTWLLLTPFFYLCFVPARLLLRLTGKDPLHLRFPSPLPSMWIRRPPVADNNQYRKQF